MPDDVALWQLSPADRLELLAFEAELRKVPRPLIDAIWAGVDALNRQTDPQKPLEIAS